MFGRYDHPFFSCLSCFASFEQAVSHQRSSTADDTPSAIFHRYGRVPF